MASIYTELKELYDKYLEGVEPVWEGKSDFKSLDQTNEDIQELTAIEEILESQGEVQNLQLSSLYAKIVSLNEDAPTSFDEIQADAPEMAAAAEEEQPAVSVEDAEDEESTLGKNEDSFENKYPEVDAQEVLKKCYVNWLDSMTNKPFFKTVASFYDLAKQNQLNFVDRAFLWKFLKAVSSCITHILIEGEQREESICLVDTYFDSLNDCLLSTIHAKTKDDVIQAFLYMVSFLGLNRDVHGEIETLDTGTTTNGEESSSIGEF